MRKVGAGSAETPFVIIGVRGSVLQFAWCKKMKGREF
jgi:hypothetical protein